MLKIIYKNYFFSLKKIIYKPNISKMLASPSTCPTNIRLSSHLIISSSFSESSSSFVIKGSLPFFSIIAILLILQCIAPAALTSIL